jgi:oligopeptidase B
MNLNHDIQMIRPPRAEKRPRTITQHGHSRIDDYFWLRYRDDPAVRAYVDAENEHTSAKMAHTQHLREQLYTELRGRIKEDDATYPERRGDFLYYTRTEKNKQYRIHCRRRAAPNDSPEEILLDENVLAESHAYFKVGVFEPSPDGNWLAFSTDFDGNEFYTLAIKNLQTNEVLPERIPHTAWGVAWASDNTTLLYVVLDDSWRSYKVMRHTRGTDVQQDVEMFREDDTLWTVELGKSSDDKYFLIHLFRFGGNEVHFLRTDSPTEPFRVVQPRMPELEYAVDHHDGSFLIVTNADGATNFKLMRTLVDAPSKENWREEIPPRASAFLARVKAFKNHIVRVERVDGLEQIVISSPDFSHEHTITFAEPIYAIELTSNPEFESNHVRFTYTSLVTPQSVIDYDMVRREWLTRKTQEIPSGYDASQYRCERLWSTSPDGTRVPISLVYKKSFVERGAGPLLLYGYGSYGANIDPEFQAQRISLLDRGVAFAIAHIRGGSEMGRAWYDDGKLMKKQNTFTDFIACADHLIDKGYTTREQLAVWGKSAGGLLIGAAITMRPDLFAVAVADVPFVDVVNTMNDASIPLTTQEWEQWGNPANEDHFHYMLSYSPYDNIRRERYPALLLKAGWNDPRVQYWEPLKFAAKMRDLKTDDNPLLLHTNFAAGHFGSSGRFDFLEELAFVYAFLLDQFDRLGCVELN